MKKISDLLPLLGVLIIFGCANNVNSTLQSRTVEEYYTSTGVDKYFLTDLPRWANFDQKAGCYRNSIIRYFDLDALMRSYNLSYNQALQVQASFNEEFTQLKKANKKPSITIKEEEILFYKMNEKVSSKILFFDPPIFKRINLVWLDEVVDDAIKEKKLKDFLNSSTMDSGVPVVVSFCLTKNEIEKKYPDLTAKMISAELFSVYDSQGKRTPGFKIDLDQFFTPAQKLYFYSQKKMAPIEEIKANYKLLTY